MSNRTQRHAASRRALAEKKHQDSADASSSRAAGNDQTNDASRGPGWASASAQQALEGSSCCVPMPRVPAQWLQTKQVSALTLCSDLALCALVPYAGLPEELHCLLDVSAASAVLPPPGTLDLSRVDNTRIDRLVAALGRYAAVTYPTCPPIAHTTPDPSFSPRLKRGVRALTRRGAVAYKRVRACVCVCVCVCVTAGVVLPGGVHSSFTSGSSQVTIPLMTVYAQRYVCASMCVCVCPQPSQVYVLCAPPLWRACASTFL